MTIIAIDIGNSRVKWAVFDADKCQGQGSFATSNLDALTAVAATWPREACIAVANVSGEANERRVHAILDTRWPQTRYLRASTAQCGVENRYEQTTQLGADRWAALIGARDLVQSACLVVCAGTATTVDLLNADGVFQGGAILPGYELMCRSLADNTAQLPLATGHFSEQPRNTMDAIVSGCLHAQVGAIERIYRRLPTGSPCLLTGGAAPTLMPHLALPVRHVENLVLEGLRRFAYATE